MKTNENSEPRKILPIIYVINTDSGMRGEPIDAVNEAMRESIKKLREISLENIAVDIQVAIVTYDIYPTWITKGLEGLEDFIWNNVETGRKSNLGLAIKTLDEKLDYCMGLFLYEKDYYPPVIIWMSGDTPIDDWKSELANALKNEIFKSAIKIAIAIGDYDYLETLLTQITESNETVITVNAVSKLKDIFVTLSSLVGSSMIEVGKINANDIVKEVIEKLG